MKLPFEKFYDEIECLKEENMPIREFKSGATRDTEEGKLDFEGFFSPIVMEKFAEYMNRHRKQSDGVLRDSDNWQKGFGKDHFKVCMKSWWRHFFDTWKEHRGLKSSEGMEEALMGSLFNNMAYAHEYFEQQEQQEKYDIEQTRDMEERIFEPGGTK